MCRTGSAAAKEDLSSRFRNVVKAYAGIDFLRFGPMLEGGRRERLSFWPDPRGFVGRQLRLILLNKDEAVVQPGAIAKQSVAVQGLSALEGLMTDKEFPLGPGEASTLPVRTCRGHCREYRKRRRRDFRRLGKAGWLER